MIKLSAEAMKLFFMSRKRAYQLTFNEGEAARKVMKDLAHFCRAAETTFSGDERTHALLEGRREVFLRITNYLHLTQDELMAKYVKGPTE